MTNFSHLHKLRVDGTRSVEFTFYEIEGCPTLFVRPAHQTNLAFFNAALKQSKDVKRRSRGRKGSVPTAEVIREAMEEDALLFSQYVVVDWADVKDADGQPVEFNSESCYQFLTAIPDEMFVELRTFCLNIENFRDNHAMDSEELEDLRGN